RRSRVCRDDRRARMTSTRRWSLAKSSGFIALLASAALGSTAGCELLWFGDEDPCAPLRETSKAYDYKPDFSPSAAQLEAELDELVDAGPEELSLASLDGGGTPVFVDLAFEPRGDKPLRLVVSDGPDDFCESDYGSALDGRVRLDFSGVVLE